MSRELDCGESAADRRTAGPSAPATEYLAPFASLIQRDLNSLRLSTDSIWSGSAAAVDHVRPSRRRARVLDLVHVARDPSLP